MPDVTEETGSAAFVLVSGHSTAGGAPSTAQAMLLGSFVKPCAGLVANRVPGAENRSDQ